MGENSDHGGRDAEKSTSATVRHPTGEAEPLPQGDFRTLFESIPGLYLVLTPSLKIVAVTDAYAAATMTERKQILGRYVFDVFPDNPNDPNATGVRNVGNSLARVLSTKAPDAMPLQKYDIRRAGDEGGFVERWWSPVNSPVIGSDGEVKYIIHRVQDVTEFIHLKEHGTKQEKVTEDLRIRIDQMAGEIFLRAQEIEKVNRQLRAANERVTKLLERANELDKLRTEFFANVSHELRTPLTLILAPVESLLNEIGAEADGKSRGYLETVHNNAIRLLQMVNGLLDFSKLEAGKLEVKRQAADVVELTKSLMTDFAPLIQSKKIKVKMRFGDFQSPSVFIDRYLFERILFNLLSNAVKFTPEDGSVTVSLEQHEDRLRLSVRDTGVGIPAEQIKHLFQKFRQVGGTTTRRFEGTGLGLALVKEFSRLLGGDVWVKSSLGEGSTFTVEIVAPVSSSVEGNQQAGRSCVMQKFPEAATRLYGAEGTQSGEKVLIAEDNPEMASYIAGLLRELSLVRVVSDGEEAVDAVRSWKPDLLLCDVMMPKMDGFSVCRCLKSQTETALIPVVLITALTDREAMLQGWEAGADEYLFKPFHPKELLTRVRSLLRAAGERKKAEKQARDRNTELLRINTQLQREIAERKRTESALEEAKRAAEHANRAKDEFIAVLSHELRTPLMPVLTGLDALQGNSTAEPQATMEMMRRNIMLESRMIDDLLDVARIVRGKLTFQMEAVDLHTIISNVMETCRAELDEKHVAIQVTLDAAEHFVEGDASRLHQIVRNVLQNAVRYSYEGGRIELGTRNPEAGVIGVRCRDYGIGIEPVDLARIFRAFEQAERSLKAGKGGLGLGLAISKALVEAHGGTLVATSEGTGKGCTFEIRFQTIPEPAELPQKTVPPHPEPLRRPLRILLVEDHDDTRLSLERLLRRFGYEVQSAQDAVSARQKIEKNSFDILISDIGLPGQSGLELVREIRRRHPIPAIALSGFGMETDVRQSRAAGFTEHLVKPIDFTKLREAVERQSAKLR